MLPVRLAGVAGLAGRANDILYHPPSRSTDCQALVYFGGDVQEYAETMSVHRDNARYVRWSLESTARLLAATFPRQHILVVRASRFERKTLSCYDNFVSSNAAGVPEHAPTHRAIEHLDSLLQNASARLKEMAELKQPQHMEEHESGQPSPERAGASGADARVPELEPGVELSECGLTLVGFSKGCVVLNQLVHQLHHAAARVPRDLQALRFMTRVSALYWLDGGHAGGAHTWITSRHLLQALASLDTEIHVHVSEYQVCDPARPWIGREERAFTSTLSRLGAKITRQLHKGPSPPSLLTHFSVLEQFGSTLAAEAPDHEDT